VGIAGAGFGAAKALEQIMAEQMLQAQMVAREREAQARTQLDRDRLDESTRQFNVRAGADDRERRDRNNTRGLDLMRADQHEMDTEQALAALPPHLKSIAGLVKIGAVGKLGPEDMEDPAARAAREAAVREQGVQDQIRIRRASIGPSQPRERKQIWVTRNGQPTPIEEGTAQPGDVPYDAVAARSSKPKDTEEAQDTAREAKRLATDLLNSKGFNRAFGVVDSMIPTMNQDTADAEIIRDSLKDMLTVESMDKMKGVLSDSDMKVLRSAATTLNGRMSESAARRELNRIIEVMGRVGGEGPTAGLPSMDLATSRDKPPAGNPVDALIQKYGRKPQ
jgi:hypothetical protein